MLNQKAPEPNPTINSAKLDRKLRLSLPDKEKPRNSPAGARRNTISEESAPKGRKKMKAPYTPTIPEDEVERTGNKSKFVIEDERKSRSSKVSRNTSDASKTSASSTKTTKSTAVYDNLAYEGDLNESRPPSRTPSIQSKVYREQYCCCAKRTKCERYLLVTVTILSIIVVVLVLVIIILAKNGNLKDYNMLNF